MIKRHVVRAILRDIFRIMSDGILFPTDKIRENSEENQKKVGECRKKIENPRKNYRRNDFEPS